MHFDFDHETRGTSDTVAKLCDDFESAWESGQQPDFSSYISNLEEPVRDDAFLELLKLDLDYRTTKGEQPVSQQDYLPQFAKYERDVIAAFEWLTPNATDLPKIVGYEVVKKIGEGGMGVVYQVEEKKLRRELAAKVLKRQLASDIEARKRFIEEPFVTSQLDHPGIVPVYDTGTLADGRPYMVMSLMPRMRFRDVLRERESLHDSMQHSLQIFLSVCNTIAFAHSRGIIHRDLKPGNVMIGAFGDVRVMDWGLAKRLGETTQSESGRTNFSSSSNTLFQTQTHLGTFQYMPPEQARAQTELVSQRSDVFGLGAMLCEILTGQCVYTGSPSEVMQKAERCDLQPALQRLDHCEADADLIHLAKRCLCEDPADRPANGKEVADAVNAYFEKVQHELQQAEIERSKATERERARRNMLALGGVVLAVLSVIVAGAWMWLNEVDSRRRLRKRVAEELASTYLDQTAAKLNDLEAKTNDPIKVAYLLGDMNRWQTELTACQQSLAAATEITPDSVAVDSTISKRRLQLQQQLEHHELGYELAKKLDDIRMHPANGATQRTSAINEFNSNVATDFELARELGTSRLEVIQQLLAFFRDELHVDFESTTAPEIAAAIRKSPARYAIVAALDYWSTMADASTIEKILATARLADPDPVWRDTYRQQKVQSNAEELSKLAKRPEFQLQSPQIHVAICELQLAADSNFQARDALVASARLYPRDYWIHLNLSRLSLTPFGRFGHAMTVLSIRPEASLSWLNLGVTLEGVYEWADALSAYRRAIELNGRSVEARVRLIQSLLRRGNLDEALVEVNKAIAKNPKSVQLSHQLGLVHERSNNDSNAIRAYQHAVELNPAHAASWLRLALLQYDDGDFPNAQITLHNCRRLQGQMSDDQRRNHQHISDAIKLALSVKQSEANDNPTDVKASATFNGTLSESHSPNFRLGGLHGGKQSRHEKRASYLLNLRAGVYYLVDVNSTEFNPRLYVEDQKYRLLAVNDDRLPGEATGGLLVFSPPADGVYRIVVANEDENLGAFELAIRETEAINRPLHVSKRLSPKDSSEFKMDGIQNKGTYFDLHPLRVERGGLYLIEMQCKGLNGRLRLDGYAAQPIFEQPKRFSNGFCRMAITPPTSGVLNIFATTHRAGEFGDYELRALKLTTDR